MKGCGLCAKPVPAWEGCIGRVSTGFGAANKIETKYCSVECRAIDSGEDVVIATTRQVRLHQLEWLIDRNEDDDGEASALPRGVRA